MAPCLVVGWFSSLKTIAVAAALAADILDHDLRVPLLQVNIVLLAVLLAQHGEYLLAAGALVSAAMPPIDANTMRLYAAAMAVSHMASRQFTSPAMTVSTIIIPWLAFETFMLTRPHAVDPDGVDATRSAMRIRGTVLLITFAVHGLSEFRSLGCVQFS